MLKILWIWKIEISRWTPNSPLQTWGSFLFSFFLVEAGEGRGGEVNCPVGLPARVIIGHRDRKRAPFLLFPMIWDNFSIFRTIVPSPRHTRVHSARSFADVAGGKWRTKLCMPLAYNSTRLCLLEMCLSIFVVSCSSLREVRQSRI